MQIGILTGPTASGKSDIAYEWASLHPGIEIINADSMLVYQEMNIGTAKPTAEELKQVPHHLVDIITPGDAFTAGEFVRRARGAIQEVLNRGKKPLIVGGTSFYLKALLYGTWAAPPSNPQIRKNIEAERSEVLFKQLEEIDPSSASRIGPNDRYRIVRALEIFKSTGKTPSRLQSESPQTPDPSFLLWVIDRPDTELHERIRLRTEKMLQIGLVDEYKKIHSKWPKSQALKSVGYAQVGSYIAGESPKGRKIKEGLEGLNEEIQLATRQLVKSQRTWFKSFCKQIPNSKRLILEAERALLDQLFQLAYGADHSDG